VLANLEGKQQEGWKGRRRCGYRGKSPGVRSLPPVQDKVVSGAARGGD
jgi:hypothetical protein